MNSQILAALVVAPVLALASIPASAQSTNSTGTPAASSDGRGYGMGPGMMSGYGAGASQRGASDGRPYGPGEWPMGPGMMGGWDSGYGMGPWMMGGGYGGWGMGPWMMGGGGYGMAPWTMGAYNSGPGGSTPMLASLDLSDAQIKQIDAIQEAREKKQWALMTSMHDAMVSGRHSFDPQTVDVDAAMKTAKTISEIRLQMLRNQLESQKQILGVLSAEQQQKLRQYGRRGR
ncbi:Spy/CpxP family protein refolding chaperone [Pandoraea communis]|uniref:Spy/CpxP family protein refolding chaperone n=1 Tax=Pandoraea communis TaxID=2508297 RepID=UPI0025A505A3|nr:Spy/CpxP family protein refolding chaperone [Pandoraea communis]MDM8355109.1 Spy/CpxP family protein refolding chaperone [Pandoraea communis]